MKLAITVVKEASVHAPLVLRGEYAKAIEQAGRIGYDAVELHVPDPDELDLNEIKRACNSAGVTVSSIGTGLAFVRDGLTLTSPDAAVRRTAIDRLKGFVRIGGELGSVVIIGLMKGHVRDCLDRPEFDRFLTDALDQTIPVAQQSAATLVLEAVNRYEGDALNTIAECAEFTGQFDDPDCLKVHIDTFHMNIEEDHIGANIRAIGRSIGHVHVADSQRGYPGSGHYDFAETIAALKAINYRGAISVECLGLPTPEEAARRGCEFLRRALA